METPTFVSSESGVGAAWQARARRAACGVVSLAMIAGAAWLFWQGRSHDRQVSSYRIAAAEVRNIGRLVEDWQAETARVWANAVADLAELDTFAARIAQYEENLANAVLGLPSLPPKLANDLSAYSNAIDARTARVERFKSSLEATRTSVQRLPALVAEVEDAADRSGQETGIADQVAGLAAQLATYAESPDEPTKASLMLALEKLAAGAEWYAPALANAVTAFAADAGRILALHTPTDALFTAATSGEIDVFADDLASTLENAWADVASRGTRNQVLALGLGGAAPLVWLAVAMQRGAGGAAFAGALPIRARRGGYRPLHLPLARLGRRTGAVRVNADAEGNTSTAKRAGATSQPNDAVADSRPSTESTADFDSDVRTERSLLRTRLLMDLVAQELVSIAQDMDGAAAASARLAELAKGLAAKRWVQNMRYGTLDVNRCVHEAIAAGTRCGFVSVVTQFAARPTTFAAEAEVVVMLANLVDNAVRAACHKHGDGGRIEVVTTVDGGKATVTIADNGGGLPAKLRDQPFQPFRNPGEERLGTGLATAQALAKRNDATISLHSTDDGTVARVVLPCQ